MAENGREILEQSKPSVDKDFRVRSLKDRQNEERQRKLEEIKAQALAAQRFKEQKEQERRRRLEDTRQRDDVRRMQVEERKKAINEAERDRLEFIIKRNHVREQRMESRKRNERSNVVFAFGSSTPRMLEPADMAVSFWGARRATSIQNIVSSTNSSSSLTRRQSERDLDVGNKKRATSATGLERTAENNGSVVPAGCASGYLGRRRTDLVPTVPTRDPALHSSRKSLNHSPASSRPSSSLSQQSTNSVASSASVRHRMSAAPRKPRPVSIAVTGVTHDLRNDTAKPPLPRARRVIGKAGERTEKSDKAGEKSDRAGEKSDKASEKSDKPGEKREKGDRVGERNEKERVAAAPRPKVKSPVDVASKAGENAGQVVSKDETQQKPPDIAPVISQVNEQNLEENGKLEESITDAGANIKDDPNKENVPESKKSDIELVSESRVVDKVEIVEDNMREGIKEESREMERQVVTKIDTAEIKSEEKREGIKSEEPPQTLPVSLPNTNEVSNGENIETSENIESNSVNEMTASMTKIRITTEEEAKAALAERRRLIREEAERQAEMERLRIEAEAKAEIERQQREEEQVRHLIELQRQTEQERLQEAIRETQKREEEERLRREEEQRLKVLKEESDRKAKEEAEKQKAELQEKLKNEEKEREARRKRVEAIMLRTRGKNNANLPSQQSTDDKNNENKSDENKDNDSKVNGTKIVEQQENGTTNSSEDADIVDNIIPSEIVKNANTVTIETMNSSDSLNSNNSWRGSQQYDSLM